MKKNKFLIGMTLIASIIIISMIFWEPTDDDTTEASKLNVPKVENPFFLKGNAYISLHQGETFSLSLPFLFGDSSIGKISAVTFDTGEVEAEVGEVNETRNQYGKAGLGYLNLDIKINKAGIFKAQKMTLISGESSVTVAIGKLIFDVDNDAPPANLEFSGAAAQTAMNEYTLAVQNNDKSADVTIKSVTAELAAMHLHTLTTSVPAGKSVSRTLTLSGDPERYAWYVLKPKVVYVIAGHEKMTSGYPTILQPGEWSQENVDSIFENKADSEYK
ncbi:hypothetical protein [Listeria cornellensis]|uniref:Uncharacterized protein n=1 Tax=Listeria cornellensis FSL F6-0969 TaxID=1265820 RepID=W7BLW1_9LIST|nr:hypothetical protein [Listeria cornellensis]EUJ26897.1 hypothetical protein PCORN_13915 [Listeria cornellensis FSL F6-0969]